MVRYLIQRPIAVLMIFAALLIAGLVVIGKIPVSLLPNVDVPRVMVRVHYPNVSASVMEERVVRPLRESLMNINNLKSIDSRSGNHAGLVYLTFEYGTRMNLAFIEVNEQIDRITASLPRDMQRPQVARINTADIPVIRLQVIPKAGTSIGEVTSLTEKVLKKRLEQLNGVSLVDINGVRKDIIGVIPDGAKLSAVQLTEQDISEAIRNANRELGGLSVTAGQYRYFVKLANRLEDVHTIGQLPITLKDGTVIRLNQVARLEQTSEIPTGYHFYNGKEGLVVTIQKQPDSRMNELVPLVKEAVELFKREYPQVQFELTQDQTFLLDAGIGNLEQDLLYGGILTILLLFLFLGNWASPSLMSISIPLSLIITFIFFYLFGISFNIISLSGLALGIGMLIDNSIVVIDSITRKRVAGKGMLESSVEGTNEVIAPVISQVLTTIAVYAPLILLSGMAGALVFDQAIGLTISLSVSLLVAFILAPLLYKLLLKTPPDRLKKDTALYAFVAKGYHAMIHHILQRKLLYFLLTIFLMPIGIWLATKVPITGLPKLEKRESLVMIDWNEAIDARENLQRIRHLYGTIQPFCQVAEAEVGIKQFLLQAGGSNIQQAELYFACNDEATKMRTDKLVASWLQEKHPLAALQIIDAPNAFTQLFNSTAPYFEARFKPSGNQPAGNEYADFDHLLAQLPKPYEAGAGLLDEPNVSVVLDYNKLSLYDVDRSVIEEALQQQFGVYTVSDIRRFGDNRSIQLQSAYQAVEAKLGILVVSRQGVSYPLNNFVTLHKGVHAKFITADKSGPYRSVAYTKDKQDIPALQQQIATLATQHSLNVEFTGQYFDDRQQVKQLWMIFLIVLFLLYFILAVQYEDLVQPIIVMLTIPLGITGGMFLLWVTGGTLDVMAVIGFIVILGLIVDDPILKIETLNRLEKRYAQQGLPFNEKLLERMIHEAGDICLKPLLMVSLTTSIALVPVLFVGGIGNDLQKPLAIVIIGGLTIGTFFTTWFIPLAYWQVAKWRNRKNRQQPLL
ncbi:efflux RND transporter permease subunit [Paraflavitalea sp. CAU 1676]|uniref:efflux RND transporter permease subunit n=1 Tax=Paraflavitalea sp. CAU 1676 TaxID=3032598 RepID=UPI0023DC2467|nr:efflux RND transporter permease subunit [Paraflavitalea sp. CAU 1676]MDF2191997.1 efflux RND transporter permease subunit [Paraflavitalea sp. CAU 1676]